MREGMHWSGNHPARFQQQGNHRDQISILLLKLQDRKKSAKFLILCFILYFLTLTISRTSRVFLSTETLSHQTQTRGIIFQLFRYYKYPQYFHNKTLTASIPVHQRRIRNLLNENSLGSHNKHLSKTALQKSNEDELQKQGIYLSPLQHNQTSKRRMGQPRIVYHGPQVLGRWPVLGGLRESDLDIQPFFVKIPIGSGKHLQEYFMHIDTGSGVSWVMCKGRGPVISVGPNGLFKPKTNNFLNCKRNKELCKGFQEDVEYPCDSKHKFKCMFDHEYGDGLTIEGHIVVGDVGFEAIDGSHSNVHIAFGCADKVDDKNTKREGQTTAITDGLIGLGPHQASWLQQLNLLGLISEDVIAICLESASLQDLGRAVGSQFLKPTGFLSFGNLYSTQHARTTWTANIPSDPEKHDSMYTGRLIGLRYRKIVLALKEGRRKKDVGVQMGFDTGSDLSYLTKQTFDAFISILDKDAKSMGYSKTHDSDEFVEEEQRKCWTKGSKKSSVNDFGDLILMFSSPASVDTTSDLVIRPKYYITSGGSGKHRRTCFNMLKETEFDFGNFGEGPSTTIHIDLEVFIQAQLVVQCSVRAPKPEESENNFTSTSNKLSI